MSSWWSLTKRLWRLRRRPVVAHRRGADFLLSPRDFIDNRLLAGQPYENEQIPRAKELIQARGLDLVIDIGANFGLYTVLLGKLDAVREVIAFEPVRAVHDRLMANVYLNGLSDKVTAHRMAVSNAPGFADIHLVPAGTGFSRFDMSIGKGAPAGGTATERVARTTLDAATQAAGRRAFVKIDVEGHTLAVLEGMRGFLAANHAVLQTEVFPEQDAPIRAFLEGMGYREFARIEADIYFAKPAAGSA